MDRTSFMRRRHHRQAAASADAIAMLFAPKHSCRKAQRAASSWESAHGDELPRVRTKRRGGATRSPRTAARRRVPEGPARSGGAGSTKSSPSGGCTRPKPGSTTAMRRSATCGKFRPRTKVPCDTASQFRTYSPHSSITILSFSPNPSHNAASHAANKRRTW